ncbi:MAG: NADH:ubiquinone reductase (Na(+)-transporting) subunit C [Prolixibacteraceae bacterium]|nr:NADH:ubiquinone reductase (Na(+)-transporting) subunit C [Prolixibacteraceae bacterium]
MDKNSNKYIFIYASVMVILVAAVLSIANISLKSAQQKNISIEKKQNILSSVNIESTTKNADELFNKKVLKSYIINSKGEILKGDAFNIDMKKEKQYAIENKSLPVYEFSIDGDTKYVFPMYGAGLWGPIWGYISLDSDLNTIYGATFDHASETPGLGAEIATKKFQKQFQGKKIFDDQEKFVSITVAKANENVPEQHSVDAISGGTLTSKGLQKMLLNDLGAYRAFFKQKKSE